MKKNLIEAAADPRCPRRPPRRQGSAQPREARGCRTPGRRIRRAATSVERRGLSRRGRMPGIELPRRLCLAAPVHAPCRGTPPPPPSLAALLRRRRPLRPAATAAAPLSSDLGEKKKERKGRREEAEREEKAVDTSHLRAACGGHPRALALTAPEGS